jgi:putative nucleotidyltransferase with HDIG domain
VGRAWESERLYLMQFAADLEKRPPLPSAQPADLEAHARQVSHIQDLLSLAAALPPDNRPPVAAWDDVLGALWRRLFAKGDDIDRYVFAELWRPVLQEAGETKRFIRSCAAVAASARNLFRFQEALAVCAEARAEARGEASGALANLINTEGSVYLCQERYEEAEKSFLEAFDMANRLHEEEIVAWVGASKTDFQAQEYMNIVDTYLRQGYEASPADRARGVQRAKVFIEELQRLPCSPAFRRMIDTNGAELDILEGRIEEGKAKLEQQVFSPQQEGPYRLSLVALHGRLLSVVATFEGDWKGAYHWIRLSLKEGINHAYPAEDHFIIEQAVKVLRGLYAARDESSYESLVQDMAKLLEDKDWYTGRPHSRNVSRLAVLLGERLNESRGSGLDTDELRAAGLLHDIGKLRIGWSLLNKIAPITPKELAILRDHATFGGDLLRKMGMDGIADIVERHHETMDGSGYPSGGVPGLKSALVGVCDVYEASISPNRRYKDPKSPVTALAEIVGCSGRRYHPDVVEALINVVQRESSPFELSE